MELIDSPLDMAALRLRWRADGATVGFVPTMGNLHAGHLTLVQHAGRQCARVVVSLFVNPLQFGAGEDFDRYPRTLEQDLAQLRKHRVDAVFVPSTASFYEAGFKTQVVVKELSDILCGAFRPGHFSGVATVVLKLLNIVQPDVAVFGTKDYQQLIIIKQMVKDLSLSGVIQGVETVRESDGLAMSSRNQYLTPEERHRAAKFYDTLVQLRGRIQSGSRDWANLQAQASENLEIAGFRPQYISIRQADDLSLASERESGGDLVILGAAYLGNTRLIDNIICPATW